MGRTPGTRTNGGTWDAETVAAVWRKGFTVLGYAPDIWRQDRRGVFIKWEAYGNTNTPSGWEIDHKVPVAMGGSDDFSNLEPLQWENNRKKGDTYPWPC